MKKVFKKIIVKILTIEAKILLQLRKPKIIAITGSVGKTSTKDAVFTVVSKFFNCRKSEKSFNSEIGVPLTILGLKNAWSNPFGWLLNIFSGLVKILFSFSYPKWLILEIGADRPGDIKNLSRWIKPDISIINKIGKLPVHVEFFESPEALAEEKSFLAKALKKSGCLIVNGDDEVASAIAKKISGKRVMSFGFNPESNVAGSNYSIFYKKSENGEIPAGISFKTNINGNSLPIIIENALGKQHAYPALAAISVASTIGLNLVDASEALRNHKTPPGRMHIIKGVKNSTIIDDSYNSSPAALDEALATLDSIKTAGRKIAVLGDMRELGKFSFNAHHEGGEKAGKICSFLFTVGSSGRIFAEGALENGMAEKNIFQFEDSQKAGEELQNVVGAGDLVLIKGSQGVRMEKTVLEIMAEPQKAPELLVRQEKAWKKR